MQHVPTPWMAPADTLSSFSAYPDSYQGTCFDSPDWILNNRPVNTPIRYINLCTFRFPHAYSHLDTNISSRTLASPEFLMAIILPHFSNVVPNVSISPHGFFSGMPFIPRDRLTFKLLGYHPAVHSRMCYARLKPEILRAPSPRFPIGTIL